MKPEDVEYLAFEGGGGKAIVYLGALRVLEQAEILPYKKGGNNRLKGVAGSSGGAITAFFIAMGLDTAEVETRTTEDNFDEFFDEPAKGFVKAVVYDAVTKKNNSGYAVNKFLNVGDDVFGVFSNNKGYFFLDKEEALTEGKKIGRHRLGRFLGISVLFDAIAAVAAPLTEAFTKDSKQSPVVNKLLSLNPFKTKNYAHSLLYDRGIFSGVAVRDYFTKWLAYYMNEKYGVTLTTEEARQFTFKQFFDGSGGFDMRLVCTNITTNKPKIFSPSHTPDFPLVDAVCMSMSIPVAFRPTFVSAIVHAQKYASGTPEDVAYLQDYMGFYLDGGTTNNFPIHAFDNVRYINRGDFFAGNTSESRQEPTGEYNFPVYTLEDNLLGIRCTGGIDPYFYTNYKTKDDLYLKYLKLKPKGNDDEKLKKKQYQKDYTLAYVFDASKPLSVLMGDMVGSLYDTVMYYTEEGQVKSVQELGQTVELFSYDVGLFDFALNIRPYQKYLSNFTQRTAAVKLAVFLGVFPKNLDTFAKLSTGYDIIAIIDKFFDSPGSLTLDEKVYMMIYQEYEILNVDAKPTKKNK